MRRKRMAKRLKKTILPLLLSAMLITEPAFGQAAVYAAEAVDGPQPVEGREDSAIVGEDSETGIPEGGAQQGESPEPDDGSQPGGDTGTGDGSRPEGNTGAADDSRPGGAPEPDDGSQPGENGGSADDSQPGENAGPADDSQPGENAGPADGTQPADGPEGEEPEETTQEDEAGKTGDLEAGVPAASVTESLGADTDAPYDGKYLLVANTNTNASGTEESTGTLPTVETEAFKRQRYADDAFLTDNPDVYAFDEDGRGLIDPASVLPELTGGGEGTPQYSYGDGSAANYSVGDEREFKLKTTASNTYFPVACVCAAVSTYATVWVPKADPVYESKPDAMQGYMQQLADEFDAQFPKMTKMFGSKENVDSVYGDKDGKTALLCYDIEGNGTGSGAYIAGYFFAADLNIAYGNATGNNTDCLHIDSYQGMKRNVAQATLDPLYSKGTMVHELQHMINFSICREKYASTPTYLNEAFSEAASHLCYGADEESDRIYYYNNSESIAAGDTSLLDWQGSLYNYSLSYLFGQYIRTQYSGGDEIYKDSMNALGSGKDLLEIIADKLGVTAEELLLNFRAACFLKNAKGSYGFQGEAWAEKINAGYVTGASGKSRTLKPGAAFVVGMEGNYQPSGEGEHIQFLGMNTGTTAVVTGVEISGGDTITESGGTLQLSASVQPASANQAVMFFIPEEEEKQYATVGRTGLVKAAANGTVTVRAASVYDPSQYAEKTITISGQKKKLTLAREEFKFKGGVTITYTASADGDSGQVYYTLDGSEPTAGSLPMPSAGVTFDEAGTYTLKVLGCGPSEDYEDCRQEETVAVEQMRKPEIRAEEQAGDGGQGAAVWQRITLTAQGGAEIYYTTDGSAPVPESAGEDTGMAATPAAGTQKYTEPFVVSRMGTTTVKAVAAMDGAVTSGIAERAVTVRNGITGITLNQTEAELYVNQTDGPGTLTLTPTLTPADIAAEEAGLVWESSDEAVAAVAADSDGNGVVRAVSPGTAVISVSAGSVSASCTVTVKAEVQDKVVMEYMAEPFKGGVVARCTATAGGRGAEVYYTVDGSEPTTGSSKMDEAGVTFSVAGTIQMKLLGHDPDGQYEDCRKDRTVTVGQTKAPEITAEEQAGTDAGGRGIVKQRVTLRAQAGAVIYYTTDGSEPRFTNTGGTVTPVGSTGEYTQPFILDRAGDTTVRAAAVKDGAVCSSVAEKTLTVRYIADGGSQEGIVITLDGTSYPYGNTSVTTDVSYVYSGSAVKPEVSITNNGEPLTEGIDYTVKYANNIKVPAGNAAAANRPKVVITGRNNMQGSAVLYFAITPKNINDVTTTKSLAVVENAKAAPMLYYAGAKLAAKKDFVLDKPDKKWKTEDQGGKIVLTGIGNYTGTRELGVDVIAKGSLQKFTVALADDVKNLAYDGKPNIPGITVTNSKSKERLGADEYEIVYPADPVNAGTKKITVVGTGIYSGCSVTKSYTVKPCRAPEKIVINNSGIRNRYTFDRTGVALDEGDLKITGNGQLLKEGKDYKITYTGNKKIGNDAKYKVVFLGNYKGVTGVNRQTGSFVIEAADLSKVACRAAAMDQVYRKPGIYKTKLYVTVDNVLLKASDYTATYWLSDGREMKGASRLDLERVGGTVTVRIQGKGNYTGMVETTYQVSRCGDGRIDLSKARVKAVEPGTTVKLRSVQYDGRPKTPELCIEVKDGRKYRTISREEYAALAPYITYVNHVNKGTATVVINGDGEIFAGSKTATFSIAKRNITSR